MARRKDELQEFYDTFNDWTLERQEVALRVLTHDHHQAMRRREKERTLVAAATVTGTVTITEELGEDDERT